MFNDTYPIVGLTIPAGAMLKSEVDDAVLSYDSLQKIRVNPVPTASEYSSEVGSDAIDYTAERYTLFNTNFITS